MKPRTPEQQLIRDLMSFFGKTTRCKLCVSPLQDDAYDSSCPHAKEWKKLEARVKKLIQLEVLN